MAEILIVEDERIVGLDLKERLNRNGYSVRGPVTSGAATIDYCTRSMPDLVLMDVSLTGELDGIETAHRLRDFDNVPVVFLTAYSDSASVERAKATNPYGYVLKPFQEQDLLITVDMALSKAELEQQLQWQDQLLQTTLEGIDTAIATLSPEGIIELANKPLANLLGVSDPGEVRGKYFDRVARLSDFFRSEDGELRATLTTVDGHSLPVRYVEQRVGEADRRVLSLSDLRARVDYEQALMNAVREAEESARARQRFLSSVSHELRTPLNSIMGMSELALDLATDETQREYLGIVQQAGDSLQAFVTSILNYTMVRSDPEQEQAAPVDVSNFVDGIRRTLSAIFAGSSVEPSVEAGSSLGARVFMKSQTVLTILTSLFENVFKFCETGQLRVQVELSQIEPESGSTSVTLTFVVADEGPGVPQDKQAAIFELFSQGQYDGSRAALGGGVGLSLASDLARRIGGSISLESVEGMGSTFTFSVPVQLEENNSGMQSAVREWNDTADIPPSEISSKSKSILLVEDEPVNRLVNARMLERLGHSVTVAHNGEECLEILSDQRFDLIFMDVEMPGLDGIEATRRIRSEVIPAVRDLPIVALTGYDLNAEQNECYQAGMNRVMQKPFRISELSQIVDYFTGTRERSPAENGGDGRSGSGYDENEQGPDEAGSEDDTRMLKDVLSDIQRCRDKDELRKLADRLRQLRSGYFKNSSVPELLFRLMLACRRSDNDAARRLGAELDRIVGKG